MGTFITSIAGVFFYSVIPAKAGMATSPDRLLGFLFGIGGTVGIYLVRPLPEVHTAAIYKARPRVHNRLSCFQVHYTVFSVAVASW
ncbi:MAG: hypothetical protein MZW92_25615 [Comamonadaceae bacterium]|nr:hypothetical protein [Comamonadaceae bacterium]